VVVRAYIDESVGKYKTFALGCVIAKGTEWTWISRDWKKCLERKNRELRRAGRKCISRYHATDCQNSYDEFKGWSADEKKPFVAELLGILNKYHIHILGATLDKAELSEVYPEIKEKRLNGESYAALAWLLFPEIVREARRLDGYPTAKIVYEHGDVSGHMINTYDRWNLLDSEVFGSIEKDTWKVLPLQAADLVAFEAVKDRDNLKAPIKLERRFPLKELMGDKRHGGGRGIHFGKEGLQRLRLGNLLTEREDYAGYCTFPISDKQNESSETVTQENEPSPGAPFLAFFARGGALRRHPSNP